MRDANDRIFKIRHFGGFCAGLLTLLLIAQPLPAKETDTSEQLSHANFGGPDAVESLIESDKADKDVLLESDLFKPVLTWKEDLSEKYGLSLGSDYTSVYLAANDNLPATDDHASSGMIRFYGTWELFGRGTDNTGTLSLKFDHRHSYSDTEPSAFSLESLGHVDAMASTFNDEGWRLTNFHWRQSWDKDIVVLLAGMLSVPDYLDVYSLGSPWLHFQSLAFTTGGGTISLPGDASLGVIVGGWMSENFYLLGGFEDANSQSTDPLEGFDTFFNDNEYFKHIEVGWTTARDRAYVDNIHLTLWQVDEREDANVEDGWGANISFTHYIFEKWMPFVRAGYAKDGASLLERSVSAGLGYQPNPIGAAAGSLLGFGANWGRPNEAVLGTGLDDQYSFELFYRLQITREIAITPDIQFLIDPALNPDESSIWVFGLRARIAI
jgi:porin